MPATHDARRPDQRCGGLATEPDPKGRDLCCVEGTLCSFWFRQTRNVPSMEVLGQLVQLAPVVAQDVLARFSGQLLEVLRGNLQRLGVQARRMRAVRF